ncbi:hypothetical protein PG991_006227 [Apiospora marii]|uniref:Heterokaryon incompatibility domain-containing protein n=1 Tax=Apiospora marii TaxID=335849 RepID=A0ABR1SBE0_9PEZI
MQHNPDESSSSGLQPPANRNTQLCSACAQMFSTAGFEALCDEKGYEHGSELACYRSATEGCKLCRVIIELHSEAYYRACSNKRLVFRLYGEYAGRIQREKHILSSDGANVSNPIFPPFDKDILEAFRPKDPFHDYRESFGTGYILGRPIVDKSSERAFTAAKAWLKECQGGHPECGTCDEHPRLPTRVLDVGSMSDSPEDSPSLRLHIPSEDQRGEYLALSYCWGGEQTFVTTTQTLETMKNGFPTSEIPQTFRDAVRVTRSLGIRFLWIDALCILQDSPDDKSREIARMGHIYKNATATIMAAAAESASEGFLRGRLQETPNCEVSLTTPDGTSGLVTICPLVWADLGSMPLSKRAWCFQEHVLSSRHLHYMDKELLWQCRYAELATVCKGAVHYPEINVLEPLEISSNISSDSHDRTDETQPGRGRGPMAGPTEESSRDELWSRLLLDYTGREMSDPDDRLNAITGVIEGLAGIWRDECIFGIWRSRFVEELAWYNVSRGKLGDRSSRAPSWSWASINSPAEIIAGQLDNPVLAKVLSISANQREVILRGPLLVAKEVVPKDFFGSLEIKYPCNNIMFFDDNFPSCHKIHFFLLDSDWYGHGRDHWCNALALVHVEGRRYRRIGLKTTEGGDVKSNLGSGWSEPTEQTITLI